MTVQGEQSRVKVQVLDSNNKELYVLEGFIDSMEMHRGIPPMLEMPLSSFGKWKNFVNDFAPAWTATLHMTEDVSKRPKLSENERRRKEKEQRKAKARCNKEEETDSRPRDDDGDYIDYPDFDY